MLSIHNNLSAGAQNVTGAYVIIILVLQTLVNNALIWQSSCVIANNTRKTQKLFVQGYNLKVYDVIKYTQKHYATVVTNYIMCKPGFCVT